MSETASFVADTETSGPNRRVRGKRAVVPGISFTGDNWVGNGSAASTLTLTSPADVASAENLTGTGTFAFPMSSGFGVWTVSLAYGTTLLEAEIKYTGDGLLIVFK